MNWLYLATIGNNWQQLVVLVFFQMSYIWPSGVYLTKMIVFGKIGCIWPNELYFAKWCVFDQTDCILQD